MPIVIADKYPILLDPLFIPPKVTVFSFDKSISKTCAKSLWKMLKSAPESRSARYFEEILLCFINNFTLVV